MINNTRNPKKTVDIAPPMNPSHVFLGESCMRGVLPKKKPNMYAMISLHIIMDTGTRSLKKKNKLINLPTIRLISIIPFLHMINVLVIGNLIFFFDTDIIRKLDCRLWPLLDNIDLHKLESYSKIIKV